MRRTLLRTSAALAATLLLAACTHDLSIQIPSGPVVQGLAPTAAFSGQVIRIRGSGFDLDPSSNVVVFPGATARAFALSNGELLVRVPPDAGSGNVSVTNSLGTSAPVSGFTYQGLGQLRDLRIVQEVPLLHAPRRMFSQGGRLLADSILVSGVLDVDDPTFFVPGGARQVPSVGGGAVFTADFDGRLRRVDATTGAEVSRLVGPDALDNVVHVSGKLLGLGPSTLPASDRLAMWTLDATTLATTAGPVDTSAWISGPPNDVGDGRAVFTTLSQPGGTALRLGLANVAGASPTFQDLGDGGHAFDRNTVALAVGQGPRTLAAGSGPLAAVGLSSGDLAIHDLTSLAFESGEIATHSPDPVHGLLFVPGTPAQLLATKPNADVVLGIDLSTRKVAWSVSTRRPTRMTLHSDGLVYVASDSDDRLLIVDPAARAAVSARSIDVRPGADDGYGGVTFMPASDLAGYATFLTDAVYFPTARPRRTVRYALGDVRPIVAATKDPANFGFSTPDWTAWSASDAGIEVIDTSLVTTIAATPRRVAARGTQLLVATDGGVSVIESVAGPALRKWDGVTTLSFASVEAVGYAPSGSPWVVGSAYRFSTGRVEDILLGWSVAQLEAGADPSGSWFGGTGTALVLEDGLWCFSRADATSVESTAFLMSPSWDGTSAPGVASSVPLAPVVLNGVVSPNGRTFVHWNTRVSPDFRETSDLTVRSSDPATVFVQVGFFGLGAKVAGVAFDAAGERLFVVTRDPDQLLVIE